MPLLSRVCFVIALAALLERHSPDRCVAHHSSSTDELNVWSPPRGAPFVPRASEAAVKNHVGIPDSALLRPTQDATETRLRPTEQVGARSPFPAAKQYLSEAAPVRGELPRRATGFLRRRGARVRTVKAHEVVVETQKTYAWDNRVVDSEEQTAAPVADSRAFIQIPSSRATPTTLNDPVDLQGRRDVKAVVKSRPPADSGFSPSQVAAKNEFERKLARGLQLKVESLFSGDVFTLTGPAQFLGLGSTAIVFRMKKVKAAAAGAPEWVAAKVSIKNLQSLTAVSPSERQQLLNETPERFVSSESAVRHLLPGVTPESALEHGILLPLDVCSIPSWPSGFRAGPDHQMFPRLALFPVLTCDLFMVIESGLSRAALLYLTRQLLLSVAWLHGHGVTHNDLKLENVFLSEEGKAVIGDFGFAAEVGTSTRLKSTPSFLDPRTAEQFLQGKTETVVTEERDAWALGTLIFVLWCKSYPFFSHSQAVLPARQLLEIVVTMAKTSRPTPSFQRCHEAPPPVRDLITGYLRWSPDDRRRPRDVVEGFLAATASRPATS
ncbi:UNVERIFIED_CONTAM: rhoptry kinase family protein ROP19A [Hammondia hammondi]|eukprot:XP_008884438.1 rhoptry kinase family protein ROP19A [Hammondia hammondi]